MRMVPPRLCVACSTNGMVNRHSKMKAVPKDRGEVFMEIQMKNKGVMLFVMSK